MKKVVIIFIVLFYSCSTNKTLENPKTPKNNIFENEYLSFKYSGLWEQYNFLGKDNCIVTSPKKKIFKVLKGKPSLENKKISSKKEKLTHLKDLDKYGVDFSFIRVSICKNKLQKKGSLKTYIDNRHENSIDKEINKIIIYKKALDTIILMRKFKYRKNNFITISKEFYYKYNNEVYSIIYSSREKEYDIYLKDFNDIISSFKIKKTAQ